MKEWIIAMCSTTFISLIINHHPWSGFEWFISTSIFAIFLKLDSIYKNINN